MSNLLADVYTGKLYVNASEAPDGTWLLPVLEAEPYYEQSSRSAATPRDRTNDGRFDRSALSPEHAWRIGRDYLAHCLRYGWPMKVVRECIGAGGRILEMGCGEEIPFFRALTCDHSAVMHFKPSLYVGADLNNIRYFPQVTGSKAVILPRTNVMDPDSGVPNDPFDLVISFEVLEHMDKPDGERFLDAMVEFAARKPRKEGGKPGIILLSTPVNDGQIAKNHIYEWRKSELERGWARRGCTIVKEFGTFANIVKLTNALTDVEREVWNRLAEYHGPHTLCCIFASAHPETARNIAWQVSVPADAHGVA